MKFGLYSQSGSEGAARMARVLGDAGYTAEMIRRYPNRVPDVMIGWGWSVPVGGTVATVNRHHCGGKYRELERLDAAGVPTPRHILGRPGLRTNGLRGGQWLPRKISHYGGHDFDWMAAGENEPPGDFYTEMTPTVREFRLHVLGNEVPKIAVKIPRRDFPNPHQWIRSYDYGWAFDYQSGPAMLPDLDLYKNVAVRATRAVGYDFCAVDMAQKPDGSPIVWEVNSAPGLELDANYNAYASYFINVYNARTARS